MNQRLIIVLSIALGLLFVGIWLYIVDFGEILNVFQNVKILFIFPLGIFFMLIYFLRSLRWKIILSPVQQITIFESFNLCMTNYFVNFLIPVHAGELAKSLLLRKLKGTPVAKSLPSVYIDKVTELLPLFLLLIATPLLAGELTHIIYLASGILLLILLLLIFFLSFAVNRRDMAIKWVEGIFFFLPIKLKKKLRGFFTLFADGVSAMTSLSGRLLEILGLTLLAVLVHCAFMWLFFYSFGIRLPIMTVIVGYLLLNASFLLPAPPGFAGTLELSFLFIFSYIFGYDKNLVSAIAASSHIFMAVLFGLTGTLSMACIGATLSNIFRADQTPLDLERVQASD